MNNIFKIMIIGAVSTSTICGYALSSYASSSMDDALEKAKDALLYSSLAQIQYANESAESESEVITNTVTNPSTNETVVYSFRDIPWGTPSNEVEEKIKSSGGYHIFSNDDALRTDSLNLIALGIDHYVKDAGFYYEYSDISVAGYEGCDTGVCFMYPVVNDEIIIDEDQGEFYMAYYAFSGSNIQDYDATYYDLLDKLSSVYGTPTDISSYYTINMWEDVEGNQIRLISNKNRDYVTIGYISTGIEEKLDERKAILDAMALAEEESKRDENRENVSGL